MAKKNAAYDSAAPTVAAARPALSTNEVAGMPVQWCFDVGSQAGKKAATLAEYLTVSLRAEFACLESKTRQTVLNEFARMLDPRTKYGILALSAAGDRMYHFYCAVDRYTGTKPPFVLHPWVTAAFAATHLEALHSACLARWIADSTSTASPPTISPALEAFIDRSVWATVALLGVQG